MSSTLGILNVAETASLVSACALRFTLPGVASNEGIGLSVAMFLIVLALAVCSRWILHGSKGPKLAAGRSQADKRSQGGAQ